MATAKTAKKTKVAKPVSKPRKTVTRASSKTAKTNAAKVTADYRILWLTVLFTVLCVTFAALTYYSYR